MCCCDWGSGKKDFFIYTWGPNAPNYPMVGVDQRLNQRVALDTRISSAWRWWRCGDPRIWPRWLAEHVIFRLTEDQPSRQYQKFSYFFITWLNVMSREVTCRHIQALTLLFLIFFPAPTYVPTITILGLVTTLLGLATTILSIVLALLGLRNPLSDLIGLGSIWSSSVDSNLMWIWIGPSDWWIGVDLGWFDSWSSRSIPNSNCGWGGIERWGVNAQCKAN